MDRVLQTGDLYSDCPKCGSVGSKYLGTEAGDPIYECRSCGNRFFPHMMVFQNTRIFNQKGSVKGGLMVMSETEFRKIVDQFLEDFNDLRLMDDVAIRDPPSKHQEKLRQLCDMVRAFEYAVQKDEGA